MTTAGTRHNSIAIIKRGNDVEEEYDRVIAKRDYCGSRVATGR